MAVPGVEGCSLLLIEELLSDAGSGVSVSKNTYFTARTQARAKVIV